MKKLLALDQGEYIGGAELFFSDLLARLSSDFEIHLVTGLNKAYQDRYKNTSIELHELVMPALRPMGVSTYKKYRTAQRLLANVIDVIQPDVMISNTVRTHLLASGLANERKIPLVWMAHDRTFPKMMLRLFLPSPQVIVSCSAFVQSYYQQYFGKTKKIDYQVLYPFGLDETWPEVDFSKKEKCIGMVGKFIPWKGHDLFIEMAHQIHQRYPDYRFELIGDAYLGNAESEAFFKKCQSLIVERGLSEVFQIKTDIKDVLPHVARWQVLVHASKQAEPLGRVILEGMAMGAAVVASDLGGPKEIVRHQENGVVAKPSVSSLVQALDFYLSDVDRMGQMAQSAQKEVFQNYQWSKMAASFEQLIEKV